MASPRNSPNARILQVETPSDVVEEGLKEGLSGDRLPELSLDIDDGTLARNINTSIASGNQLHDDVKNVQDLNEDYYLGKQTDASVTTSKKKVRTIENRIFFSLESLVPVVTDRPPEPLVFSDDEDYEFARNLERVLIGKYQDEDMEDTFRVVVRHWSLYKLGATKLVHDTVENDFKVVFARPQRLIFDPRGTDEINSRFIAELVEETLEEVMTKYDEKREEIAQYINMQNNGLPVVSETPLNYWEFWTNEFVAWKLGDIILDKGKNPFWDWDNQQNNFIKRPIKPYFLMHRMFTLGKSVYDDTSLVEQAKTIQDGINKTHWAISDDLADRGTIVGSQEGIAKDELGKYRGETGEKISIEKGNWRDMIGRLEPKQVSPYAIPYKQELSFQSDNVIGSHATLRGERQGAETFSGRALLKESDTGRAAPISKILDKMAKRLYNAIVQYIKLYYTEDNFVPYVGSDGATELLRIKSADIKQGMKIQVRPGSTLPLDKFVQRNEAMELANMGQIDPITLFEKLGWPKPVESAKRVFLFEQVKNGAIPPDILFPGITQEIQQKMAESQEAGQSVAQEAGVGVEVPGPENVPPELVDLLAGVNAEGGEFTPPPEEVAAGLAAAREGGV